MEYLFIEYPKCTTCQKAKKWLLENDIKFIDRDIVKDNPREEELTQWIKKSKIPIKKFFNTSGILYKELNLKDKLPSLTLQEQIKLLASNGMLIKRPLLISKEILLIGFKPAQWEIIK